MVVSERYVHLLHKKNLRFPAIIRMRHYSPPRTRRTIFTRCTVWTSERFKLPGPRFQKLNQEKPKQPTTWRDPVVQQFRKGTRTLRECGDSHFRFETLSRPAAPASGASSTSGFSGGLVYIASRKQPSRPDAGRTAKGHLRAPHLAHVLIIAFLCLRWGKLDAAAYGLSDSPNRSSESFSENEV